MIEITHIGKAEQRLKEEAAKLIEELLQWYSPTEALIILKLSQVAIEQGTRTVVRGVRNETNKQTTA